MNKRTTKFFISIFLLSLLLSQQSFAGLQSNNLNVEQDSTETQFQDRINEVLGDSLKLLDTHFEYAQFLNDEGKIEASIENFEIALRIAKNINNDVKVAAIANWLANMYAAIGDFKASNETYKVALKSAKKTKDNGEIAKISMNLASNYNYTGDYEKAIEYGLFALKTKESTNNLTRICYHYIAMGNIFRENNNTVKWEEYVQKAYKMKDVEGCASFGDIAKIYNSLGGIAVQKEEFEKGLLYYDTLLVLSKEANYEQGISTALTNNAGIHKQLNNFDKALELVNEAEKYFIGDAYGTLFNNNFKAELYQLSGEYTKGLKLVNTNIHLDQIENYSTEKLKTLQLLYELNFNLGNYDEAFFWNDSLRTIESILRDEDIRQSLEDLETKYETEKKQQQIELLTTENKLRRQVVKTGIAIVTILFIIIILILYILHIRKKQAAFKQNDLQQQVLRAQMNPHFIFNVLGSIQNFMMQNDTRKASNFLSQFASLTRATLNNSAAETISLADEINMLKNYIELEKMRSKDKFNFEINYDEGLEVDFIQIPPMLIQPFVENSIKHGFKTLTNKGLLKLTITDKTNWVEFIIEDNGTGIQKNTEKEKGHKSMAMTIFKKRRKLIQQKYNKDFNFEIQNLADLSPEQSGVSIKIDIPILND